MKIKTLQKSHLMFPVTAWLFVAAMMAFSLQHSTLTEVAVARDPETPKTSTEPGRNDQPTTAAKQNNSNSTTPSDNATGNKDSENSPLPEINALVPINNPFVREKLVGDYIYGDDVLAQPNREYSTAATPNDPRSNEWWHQSLNLESAWDISTGSTSTVLAVIDTGIALDHEEFTGRIYENSGEVGIAIAENTSQLNCTDQSIALDMSCNQIDDNFDGIVDNESGATTIENPSLLNCTDQSLSLDKSYNLIDDDANGLADDWRGWDFINYDRSVQAGEMNASGSGTRHSTYVSAVAAGNANNGVGIAGVDWNTKILPIQAIDDDGYGNSLSVARGVRYAVAQGADVINMSLGGASPDSFLRQTIQEAIAAGVVVVVAAGNDGCDCISYPGNYPEVVTVGALNTSNQRASFSSYGANLDIMAPGTSIYTASWSAGNPTNSYASGIQGTSLATPLVSGAFTSLKSLYPTASPTELLAILTENTDRLTLTSNRSDTLGFGTADALAAYSRIGSPRADQLVTSYTLISHGGRTSPQAEADPYITVGSCQSGVTATTPIYRLSSGSSVFYTASQSERARNSGYAIRLHAYTCVVHSFDTPVNIRAINVYQEFENRLIKE